MKKKTFAAIIAATMVTSLGTGAYAATKLEEIKAFLNPELKIQVDGTTVQLQDSTGKQVIPITYNNTTYLPVRAVSDALDIAVNYDNVSKTVILGEKIDGESIAKNFNDMYHTKDPNYTSYNGKDYKEVYFNKATGNRSVGFMLYPNKEHQTLYLQVAAIGGDIEDFVVKDSDNNVILKEVEVIKESDGLTTIEVNVGGVNTLYVYGSANKDTSVFIPLTTSYYK